MAILKLPRFWGSSERTGGVDAVRSVDADGLDAFGSETGPVLISAPTPVKNPPARAPQPDGPPAATSPTSTVMPALKWFAVILVTASLAVAAVFEYQRRFATKPTSGLLTVQTTPSNLEVWMGGRAVGRTPLTLPLAAGTYDVEVGPFAQRRAIKATVAAGVTSVQHVELMSPQQLAAGDNGTLRIQTEPSNLTVLVDGVERGASPVTVEGMSPGEHAIVVRGEKPIHRTVKLQPRETLSLVLSAPAAPVDTAATGGWLTVTSPVAMQLREDGKIIGTSESERVMLPPGEHDLEILNEALGFRATRKVRIVAGKTATTRIDLPNGSLSLNAQPWAEVWLDGERIGETPIGNIQRPIGTHQVLFRHPELGERRETVVLTVQKPVRLGVDLRKK